MAASDAEQLLYTTVKLEAVANGNVIGSGTGFFWAIDLGNEKSAVFIVTNKHVLKGADQARATVHYANENGASPSGKFATIEIHLHPSRVVEHPDAKVDLCAFLVSDLFAVLQTQGTPLYLKTLSRKLVPTDWTQFSAIEQVLMIGCPRGLYDTANSMPLVRSGITSTSVSKAYEGRDEFLVDMACFPGSSGSPVFIFNEGSFSTPQGISLGTRLLFLGVLYAGPLITNTGTIVLNEAPSVAVASMMHLGQVIRASQMLHLEASLRNKFIPT